MNAKKYVDNVLNEDSDEKYANFADYLTVALDVINGEKVPNSFGDNKEKALKSAKNTWSKMNQSQKNKFIKELKENLDGRDQKRLITLNIVK